MNIFFGLVLLLSSYSLFGASNWSKKLSEFTPVAFVMPRDGLKDLSLDEAKKGVLKSLAGHFSRLNDLYKTQLKLDYSPFGSRWQIGRFEMEMNQLTTIDLLLGEKFEKKINEIILTDYKDFISSEFVLSNHKVFDHENEIYELKKQIIFLNQQIEMLQKAGKEAALPVEPEKQTSYLLIFGVLIGAAIISILVKRAKFI